MSIPKTHRALNNINEFPWGKYNLRSIELLDNGEDAAKIMLAISLFIR